MCVRVFECVLVSVRVVVCLSVCERLVCVAVPFLQIITGPSCFTFDTCL